MKNSSNIISLQNEEIHGNESIRDTPAVESFIEKVSKLKKSTVILNIGKVLVIDLICNDEFIFQKVGIVENGKIILRKHFSQTNDPFKICNIPRSDGVFQVAYNIWKPFVFKRQVTNYDDISEENASVLDGIDIQVA